MMATPRRFMLLLVNAYLWDLTSAQTPATLVSQALQAAVTTVNTNRLANEASLNAGKSLPMIQ